MQISLDEKDELLMRLVNYFITEENYTPIVVNGVRDEIWLQNQDGPYKIVRINCNYIHNKEQYDFDLFKVKNVMKQVKRKTLSFSMNALNILLNVNDGVSLDEEKNIASVSVKMLDDVNSKVITECYPNIQKKMLLNEKGLQLVFDVTNKINEKTEKENKKYENIFKAKKIVITPILLFLHVVIFFVLYGLAHGQFTGAFLVAAGGMYSPLIQSGEVWRLLTAGFLHADVIHLLFNMYSLYLIGTQLENFIGKWKFLAIYLLSMITGSLMSCVLNPFHVSVGASGAIFGLLGALVYFGFHYRIYLGTVLKTQIIPLILINLMIGFMNPEIDNAAHIGGFIGGLFLAMALGVQDDENKRDRINGTIVFLLYIFFFLYLIFFR